MRVRTPTLGSSLTDYLPPSAPARQDLASGATSANVDFGYATGQTTASVSATLSKPSGSTASIGSTTDTGSAWRVALTGLTAGEGYLVQLEYTASDGQKTYQSAEVTVASTTGAWQVIADWDFTQNTPQVCVGDGTFTLALAAGNVTMVVATSTGTPVTTVALTANGLEISSQRSSGSGSIVKYFSFDLDAFFGANPDLNKNDTCIEFVWQNIALPTTSDVIVAEIGEATSASSNNPGFFFQHLRNAGPAYTYLCGARQTSNNVKSSGVSHGASLPSYTHAQLIGKGRNFEVRAESTNSLSAPWSPTTYAGDCGLYASATPTDAAENIWGSDIYPQFSVGCNSTSAVQVILKYIRVSRRYPAA